MLWQLQGGHSACKQIMHHQSKGLNCSCVEAFVCKQQNSKLNGIRNRHFFNWMMSTNTWRDYSQQWIATLHGVTISALCLVRSPLGSMLLRMHPLVSTTAMTFCLLWYRIRAVTAADQWPLEIRPSVTYFLLYTPFRDLCWPAAFVRFSVERYERNNERNNSEIRRKHWPLASRLSTSLSVIGTDMDWSATY